MVLAILVAAMIMIVVMNIVVQQYVCDDHDGCDDYNGCDGDRMIMMPATILMVMMIILNSMTARG